MKIKNLLILLTLLTNNSFASDATENAFVKSVTTYLQMCKSYNCTNPGPSLNPACTPCLTTLPLAMQQTAQTIASEPPIPSLIKEVGTNTYTNTMQVMRFKSSLDLNLRWQIQNPCQMNIIINQTAGEPIQFVKYMDIFFPNFCD